MPRKNKPKKHPILKVIEEAEQKFPEIWEDLDALQSYDDHDDEYAINKWDRRIIYTPSYLTKLALFRYYDYFSNGELNEQYFQDVRNNMIKIETITIESYKIHSLAAWRTSKEIYRIDPEMEELLYEQACDLKLPTEVLSRLPYQCFFIETNKMMYGDHKVVGFFVSFDMDGMEENEPCLHLNYLLADGDCLPILIPLKDESLNDMVLNIFKTGYEASKKIDPDRAEQAIADGYNTFSKSWVVQVQKSIQLILYILSSNADIKENRRTIEKNAASKSSKIRYGEVRVWDVGERVGAAYNQAMKDIRYIYKGGGNGSAKRPHMRRGHWHHFWTGSIKDKDKRKLILKWVPPTPVNMLDADLPINIHEDARGQ